MIIHLSKNEKLSDDQIEETMKLRKILSTLLKERTFFNKKDLDFYKNMDSFVH